MTLQSGRGRKNAQLPVLPLASANSLFQPIFIGDLVKIIVECINIKQPSHRLIYECVGPQVFSLYELVKIVGKHSKRSGIVVPLPKLLGYCQAFLMELLPGEPLMSRDNLASASIPNVSSNDGKMIYKLKEPTDIESVAPTFL